LPAKPSAGSVERLIGSEVSRTGPVSGRVSRTAGWPGGVAGALEDLAAGEKREIGVEHDAGGFGPCDRSIAAEKERAGEGALSCCDTDRGIGEGGDLADRVDLSVREDQQVDVPRGQAQQGKLAMGGLGEGQQVPEAAEVVGLWVR